MVGKRLRVTSSEAIMRRLSGKGLKFIIFYSLNALLVLKAYLDPHNEMETNNDYIRHLHVLTDIYCLHYNELPYFLC